MTKEGKVVPFKGIVLVGFTLDDVEDPLLNHILIRKIDNIDYVLIDLNDTSYKYILDDKPIDLSMLHKRNLDETFVQIVDDNSDEKTINLISKEYGQSTGTIALEDVDQMPYLSKCSNDDKTKQYECSEEKLIKLIYSKLKYPYLAKTTGIQGDVYIQYIISKEGKMTGFTLLNDIGAGCGEAVLEVFQKGIQNQKWNPGIHNGKAVDVMITIPIKFRIG